MAVAKQSLTKKSFHDLPLGLTIKTKTVQTSQTTRHSTNQRVDILTKRDPEAFLRLSKADTQELKKGFGHYSSIGELENQLYMVIQIETIQIPLDRSGFAQVCRSFHKQCTQLQAIEAILVCKGADNPDSYQRLLQFLYKTLPLMPPIGRPRALIEAFKERNPIISMLPQIKKTQQPDLERDDSTQHFNITGLTLEQQQTPLAADMKRAIQILKRDHKLSQSLQPSFADLTQKFGEEIRNETEEKWMKIKRGLQTKLKLDKEEKKTTLETIVGLTAQKSCLQAIKLNQLLSPRWVEDPSCYKIQSQIKTERQRARLNEMTSNRYKS